MKRYILGVIICISGTVHAVTRGPLARVFCRSDEHRVYMMPELIEQYQEKEGRLSEQKRRMMLRNYMSAEKKETFIAKLAAIGGVPVTIKRGGCFFLPKDMLEVLGCSVSPSVDLSMLNIYYFIMFWRPLIERMREVPQSRHEEIIVARIRELSFEENITALRYVGKMLGMSQWYQDFFASIDSCKSDLSEPPTPESIRSESASCSLSLESIVNSRGDRVKRRDFTWLLCQEGAGGIHEHFSENGTLSFKGCRLHSIHDLDLIVDILGMGKTMDVKIIDLSNNGIMHIPEIIFTYFPAVHTILLNNNPIESVDPLAFSGMPELRTLDMTGGALTRLPPDIFRTIPCLQQLILADNKLVELPSVADNDDLYWLDLRNNGLTHLPDMSGCRALDYLDLSHNFFTRVSGMMLPLPEHSSLNTLLLRRNQITALEPEFIRRLPVQGTTDLRDNPLWNNPEQISLITEGGGFEQLSDADIGAGRAAAGQVRDMVFIDMREKLCDYLLQRGHITQSVIRDEIVARRALSEISTTPSDIGLFVYRYGYWALLGGAILGAAAGGGIMFFFHAGSRHAASWVLSGAIGGGALGATLGYAGYSYAYDGSEQAYLHSGRGREVHMSTVLRDIYTGTYRLIALFALLKQFLIAINTTLYWLLHYDELVAAGQSERSIIERLDMILHVATGAPLGQPTSAGCVVMLADLLTSDAVAELHRTAPADMFPAATLLDQPLSHDATYPFLGVEKLAIIRNALDRCAQVTPALRAALVNRYLDTHEYQHLLAVVAELDPLRAGLDMIGVDVIESTRQALEAVGHSGDVIFAEFVYLHEVVRDTQQFITQLQEHAETFDGLRALACGVPGSVVEECAVTEGETV